MHMPMIPAFAAVLAFSAPLQSPADTSGTIDESTAVDTQLFDRIVVVGASASEGFGLEAEFQAPAVLSQFIDAAWAVPTPTAKNLASSRFFLDPLKVGAEQRDAAKQAKVTLLVAVDFLFWFGYGSQSSESSRLDRLEYGLAMLDEIGGPMLVGDFPDMSPALNGKGMFGGPVISARQIPAKDTIIKLNARLDEWSKDRPNVMRVPLADFVTRLQSKQALELRGQRWSEEDCARLLQSDLLHPTAEGVAALALLCLDALERGQESCTAERVHWNTETVLQGVRAVTEIERAAAEAKRAAREERLRKLEERKQERDKKGDNGSDGDGGEADDQADSNSDRQAA